MDVTLPETEDSVLPDSTLTFPVTLTFPEIDAAEVPARVRSPLMVQYLTLLLSEVL